MLKIIAMLICTGVVLWSIRPCAAADLTSFPQKEGKIAVAGGNIWYKIVNPNAKGTPIICIHGGPGMPHDYLEPLAALADERPVIFYDQLGCGNSDIPKDNSLWTVERFESELATLRSELRIHECYILGQSWGSMLTVAYLTQIPAPTGVKGVIFAGPALSAPRFIGDTKNLVEALPQKTRNVINDCELRGDYENPQYQEALQEFYARHVCRLSPWPECVMQSLEKMGVAQYNYMWGPSEFTATGTLKDFDATPKLAMMKMPVLLTCGEFDEATPEATKYYCSLLPDARYIVYRNASHLHHFERLPDYLADMRKFMNGETIVSTWK